MTAAEESPVQGYNRATHEHVGAMLEASRSGRRWHADSSEENRLAWKRDLEVAIEKTDVVANAGDVLWHLDDKGLSAPRDQLNATRRSFLEVKEPLEMMLADIADPEARVPGQRWA